MGNKKSTRGGARPGAGRPNEDKIKISATVSKVVADRLAKERNKSATIEWALKDYFGIGDATID